LKRKLLFSALAAIPAAIFSLAASGQIVSSAGSPAPEPAERIYRYSFSAGYGYTSLNQVNQSRSGLQGVEFSLMRDFSKHFAAMGDGGYYKYALVSGNPGTPSVEMVLFGPEFHADLYGPISGFVRAFMGGVHTAGESETPNVSFAGGFGGGMEYKLNPRLSLRASGDDILSSFVQDPEHLGYSPHRRGNGRGSFGVVFRF
jgi:hypothetical protein